MWEYHTNSDTNLGEYPSWVRAGGPCGAYKSRSRTPREASYVGLLVFNCRVYNLVVLSQASCNCKFAVCEDDDCKSTRIPAARHVSTHAVAGIVLARLVCFRFLCVWDFSIAVHYAKLDGHIQSLVCGVSKS